jgi:riboflavin kinase / FMN adenylyltransferase
MKFKFTSRQVKGKGRGKLLGFPTINLDIPENFELEDGIYAVAVLIAGQKFIGALHYGPIPTFDETQRTLEVFLIDLSPEAVPETENIDIEIETKELLRPVLNFKNERELTKQISEDVLKTKQIFRKAY